MTVSTGFAQAWRAQLATWAKGPLPGVRKVIANVSVLQNGRDVRIAVDLGSLRQAMAKVESVVPAVMASR